MKYYKYNFDMKFLNILSIVFFIPFFILIINLDLTGEIDFNFFILYFLFMFLHELLHGVGFMFNGFVKFKNIVFGACLEKGILYCMCKQVVERMHIFISLLFPFTFIGVFTFILGFCLNNKLLQLLSIFNIVGCVGDLCMFFNFIRLPKFKYVDLDDCTGFVLISEYDLSKYKLFGFDLSESGNYGDLKLSSDFKKITVSKFSIIVFCFLILGLIFI